MANDVKTSRHAGDPDGGPTSAHQNGTRPRCLSAQSVLVVEDDPVVSKLIDHVLTRRGFSVTVAVDGRQARTLVESSPPPDVVVLDVMLPFVDGFELVETVRNQPGWADVPILMLTSRSHEHYVTRAFGAGVDDYVLKPFRPEELAARVKRLTGA